MPAGFLPLRLQVQDISQEAPQRVEIWVQMLKCRPCAAVREPEPAAGWQLLSSERGAGPRRAAHFADR